MYHAFDIKNNIDVVLRQYKFAIFLGNDTLHDIENEVKAMKVASCKNIVKCYGYFTQGDDIYIILEYVKGLTL